MSGPGCDARVVVSSVAPPLDGLDGPLWVADCDVHGRIFGAWGIDPDKARGTVLAQGGELHTSGPVELAET